MGLGRNYGIRSDYTERPAPVYFADFFGSNPAQGVVWNVAAYALAEAFALVCPPPVHFIDLGCGNGAKLADVADRHPTWKVLGVDIGENADAARARGLNVEDADLERFSGGYFGPHAIVVCA